jgi:hypothetical protein
LWPRPATSTGDGKSDLLWRNSTTGEAAIWFMNGGALATGAGLGSIGTDWVIQGVNANWLAEARNEQCMFLFLNLFCGLRDGHFRRSLLSLVPDTMNEWIRGTTRVVRAC